MLFLIVILLLVIALAVAPALRTILTSILVVAILIAAVASAPASFAVGIGICGALVVAILGWVTIKNRTNKSATALIDQADENRTITINEDIQTTLRQMMMSENFDEDRYTQLIFEAGTVPPEGTVVYETRRLPLPNADLQWPVFYYLKDERPIFVVLWSDMGFEPTERALVAEELIG